MPAICSSCMDDRGDCVSDRDDCVSDRDDCVSDRGDCVSDRGDHPRDREETVSGINDLCKKTRRLCEHITAGSDSVADKEWTRE